MNNKIKLHYIRLDGKFTWGANNSLFGSIGDAKKSVNSLLKEPWYREEITSLGLKNSVEYREYLEKNNRLKYPIVEL